MSEQELSKALDAIAAANPSNPTNVSAAAAADICTIYKNDVRPLVMQVLPIIRLFAPKIADVIDTLVGIADKLCP